MKPADMKCVGKMADGEPIYQVSTLPTTGPGRAVPVAPEGSLIDDDGYNHRVHCLPCLLSQLQYPVEELDEFLSNAGARILEIDRTSPEPAEYALQLQAERQQLVNELALAGEAYASLKALLQLLASWL